MKIFLSSTILDLRDLRDALVNWLTADGHQIIASEKGTLRIEPGKHSYEQCLKAAAECDYLVAVIDGRFGGEYPQKGSNQSITEAEIEIAITQGKKTLVFVRQSIWDSMTTQQVWVKSGEAYRPVKNIIEDVRVFGMIDRLKKRPRDNWIFTFNYPTDLIETIRAQIGQSQSNIDWLSISQGLLAEHKQRLSSNPLQNVRSRNFDGVYVPLGMVERKTKERPSLDRGLDPSADRGSELYQIETTPIEHDEFLKAVIDRQPGEHIVILGEPGAGKTTLLTRVWQSLLDNANPEAPAIVAWIPLAALGNQSLQKYVEESWLAQVSEDAKAALSSFTSLRQAGKVCLLLDGADELGGDGLQKIEGYLRMLWAKPLKVVVTCRLNLWDGGGRNELKQNFQIFRTLDFKYVNSAGQDDVAAFIGTWFDDVEEGKRLRTALDEVGKERIKDLAQNPLRLTLLCNIWQREQGLPETQAGLYERFVPYVYAWRKVDDAEEMQLVLDRAMGTLAKYGINKPSLRFRFTQRELQEQLPDIGQRKLLKALGWLNCVGVDEAGQEVYAFFHPTFQEYFAACGIDDWDYFLPRAHVDQPVLCSGEDKPTYRVFEKQWQHVILLWIGRCDLDFEQKEKFIEKMINFKGLDFYDYQAYHLAAICTGEFRESSKAQYIVNEITKQAFGYWDENQEWEKPGLIAILAKSTIPFVHRDYAITSLMKLLENKIPHNIHCIVETLGGIASGRKDVSERIIVVLEGNESEICLSLAHLLTEIVIKEDSIVTKLLALLKREDLTGAVRAAVAWALKKIAIDNKEVIDALLITLDNCNDICLHGNIIRVLGKAKIRKEDIVASFLTILGKESPNNDLYNHVEYALEDISDNNDWAIDYLIKLISGNETEIHLHVKVLRILGSIAISNQNAIDYLIGVLSSKYDVIYASSINDTAFEALKKIAIGSKPAISCLLKLLKNKQLNSKPYFKIVKVLSVVAEKEQWVVEEIARLIEENIFDSNSLPWAIHVLGVIGVKDQKAIKVLNTLLDQKELEPCLRFTVASSLLQLDSNKELAVFELEKLLEAEVAHGINFEIVLLLLTNNINHPAAIRALNQIFEEMKDPEPLQSIQNLLEQSAVNSEEIIKMLLHFWGDGGLKFNMNIVVSEILRKIAISNEATIEHALKLLTNRNFGYSALSVLGQIAIGHEKAIREVVKILIQNKLPLESRHQLAQTLKMIVTRETGELVISQLRNYVTQESSESNNDRCYYCLDVLLHYAQIFSYQEFYRLWALEDLDS